MSAEVTAPLCPARAAPQSAMLRRIFVLTVHAGDWELLKQMHAAAQARLPGLEMDVMISTIVADACAFHRAKQSPMNG